ncbi:glycosyltransferase [Arthrobacter sp. VKM Ac-2550]|uniref:glycosyltransferase n=1 Tax=Crystallibacter permensis TaxID=1938888 RepID=UPI002226009C|nr:glycosyltransferase [Arthrobacter sp. VKM Ac-2550]MCW2135347.1 Glycosyltransferase involved in cell wall bisynthesis [Arthrobacter sp. VKM Ac-2550]
MKQGRSVLHITESFASGVASAITQYSKVLPEFEHHLLGGERSGDFIDSGETSSFLTVRKLPKRPLAAIRAIKLAIRELSPDVIHAHSSYAGFFVRVSQVSTRQRPIVYTPHGYAFERADLSPFLRTIFRLIEAALALNTSAIAACSPREAELSKYHFRRHRVVYVPNVFELPFPSLDYGASSSSITVVGSGRITPARDPGFFAAVARIVRQTDSSVRFKWIGAGDAEDTATLIASGVEVTGWCSRQDALEHFAAGNIHLHTSAWDGFPMVILEANALRIPSIVRNIKAFSSVPLSVVGTSVEDVASIVIDMSQDNDNCRSALELWDDFLAENNRIVQASRLACSYGIL